MLPQRNRWPLYKITTISRCLKGDGRRTSSITRELVREHALDQFLIEDDLLLGDSDMILQFLLLVLLHEFLEVILITVLFGLEYLILLLNLLRIQLCYLLRYLIVFLDFTALLILVQFPFFVDLIDLHLLRMHRHFHFICAPQILMHLHNLVDDLLFTFLLLILRLVLLLLLQSVNLTKSARTILRLDLLIQMRYLLQKSLPLQILQVKVQMLVFHALHGYLLLWILLHFH